jgi:hypothetical protein
MATPPAKPAIPEFPFPPPMPSTMTVVQRNLLVGDVESPTLKNVGEALDAAFEQCGYGKRSYFAFPGGFAMASSLEQIDETGAPKATNRWSLKVSPMRTFSLRAYLHALFNARPGHYRVIVFAVTDRAFGQSARVGAREASAWVGSGANVLPDEIGDLTFTPRHQCSALVYEFRSLGQGEAEFVDPSEITARTHLQRTGFLAALLRRD